MILLNQIESIGHRSDEFSLRDEAHWLMQTKQSRFEHSHGFFELYQLHKDWSQRCQDFFNWVPCMNYVKMSVIFSDLRHHDESPVSSWVKHVCPLARNMVTWVCKLWPAQPPLWARVSVLFTAPSNMRKRSRDGPNMVLKRKGHGALSPWPGLLFSGPTKNLRCKHSKQKEYWQVFLPPLVFVSKLGCAKWLGWCFNAYSGYRQSDHPWTTKNASDSAREYSQAV